ncbi:MAG: histidine--tRNA ligase [Deltaproteobacteria bacterium]|nr:histidine--tRNA ligase [Deltaproteobacteria bacterium]
MEFRAVRGMKDILPEQAVRWQRLEATIRSVVERYGFGEVRTTVIEATELFVRQVGEGTDIVEKEMYSFERHGDALTVRPEGTAGVARAYVQHALQAREPVTRWYYLGPMFRAERPAKGRFRQFYQAGCEHFGDPGPLCDAEMIGMAAEVLQALGLRDFAVHVSSLGSGDARARFREALRAHFEPLRAELSADSQRRLDSNPLRILDSKDERDREAIARAPSLLGLLGGEDARHFEDLRRYLGALGIAPVIDATLVRGLDYYTRTVFELRATAGELGAQDALLGGGRYDGMVQGLGGPAVPAIGFAMGLERILSLLEEGPPASGPDCYLAPLCEAGRARALVLGKELRTAGLRCELDGRGLSLRAMLRRANALGSRLCLLVGEEEIGRAVITVKDLARHEQVEIPWEQAAETLARRLASSPAPAANAARAPGEADEA